MKEITELDIFFSLDKCDKQIIELKNNKVHLMACLGQIFIDNNTEKTVTGTLYEETAKEIYEINQQILYYKKCRLWLLGEHKSEECEQCGWTTKSGRAFCGYCGRRLTGTGETGQVSGIPDVKR